MVFGVVIIFIAKVLKVVLHQETRFYSTLLCEQNKQLNENFIIPGAQVAIV
jgi:hypothetical protein